MKVGLITLLALLIVLVAFGGCTQEDSEPVSSDTSTPVEEGLSDALKKEVYFELVKYQGLIGFDDPDYAQKNQDAYKVLAERYRIEESDVRSLVSEGVKEDWLVPPLP